MRGRYTIALDLGQAADFSALAVLERVCVPQGRPGAYAVRHLQRFPLGTRYTTIVPAACDIARSTVLRGAPSVVDQTGVGRPVVEMLARSGLPGQLVAVTITAGQAVTAAPDGGFRVPKKELVTCLQLLLQG